MPEYLDDPSVLTKDKLKSELLAHNVSLPSGNPAKDVYVQLYLKNLTAQNKKNVADTTLDAFSSDEELPPPVVSNRNRSFGRKATRKTDRIQPDEVDVTVLTDQGLRDELLKHGVDVGPIVASSRKLYERKLQKLLDDGPARPPLPQLVLTEIQGNHNINCESELYSDKEDEVTSVTVPEPVVEPEPVPVVERAVRSRGKTPVTSRHHSTQPQMKELLMDEEEKDEEPMLSVKRRSRKLSHRMQPEPAVRQSAALTPEFRSKILLEELILRGAAKSSFPLVGPTTVDPVTFSPISPIKSQESHWTVLDPTGLKQRGVFAKGVEKIAAGDQTSKLNESDILKELVPNDINSPTRLIATCRQPIKGAAGRPVKSSDLWNDENSLFSPKHIKTSGSSSSYTERLSRLTSLPSGTPSTSSFSSSSTSSRLLSATPPAVQTKAARHSVLLWIKLFLLAIVAAFLFLVYQAMETNTSAPFPDSEVAIGSTV
ncbi:thymopoietin a isoform X1 [Channa argus]|uniref:thymopoietin a isoform X1 n=1 Tax=Channa argus TaxID=215402 RepID=UPI0035221CC3